MNSYETVLNSDMGLIIDMTKLWNDKSATSYTFVNASGTNVQHLTFEHTFPECFWQTQNLNFEFTPAFDMCSDSSDLLQYLCARDLKLSLDQDQTRPGLDQNQKKVLVWLELVQVLYGLTWNLT